MPLKSLFIQDFASKIICLEKTYCINTKNKHLTFGGVVFSV